MLDNLWATDIHSECVILTAFARTRIIVTFICMLFDYFYYSKYDVIFY